MPDWWLDERAHAGDEHLDTGYVDGYDRKSGFDSTDDVNTVRRLGLTASSVVVDMGAGTGAFTVGVAEFCREVIAVDVSPAMIAALRAHVDRAGLGNVSIVEAGFLSYQHGTEPAHFVYTRNALHHLPDFWKAIALHRIGEMLRPGGVLLLRDLVFDFEPSDAERSVEAWFSGAAFDPAEGYTAEELATHVRTEFSTYSWLLEPMIERAGFRILERQFQGSVYGTYICEQRAT